MKNKKSLALLLCGVMMLTGTVCAPITSALPSAELTEECRLLCEVETLLAEQLKIISGFMTEIDVGVKTNRRVACIDICHDDKVFGEAVLQDLFGFFAFGNAFAIAAVHNENLGEAKELLRPAREKAEGLHKEAASLLAQAKRLQLTHTTRELARLRTAAGTFLERVVAVLNLPIGAVPPSAYPLSTTRKHKRAAETFFLERVLAFFKKDNKVQNKEQTARKLFYAHVLDDNQFLGVPPFVDPFYVLEIREPEVCPYCSATDGGSSSDERKGDDGQIAERLRDAMSTCTNALEAASTSATKCADCDVDEICKIINKIYDAMNVPEERRLLPRQIHGIPLNKILRNHIENEFAIPWAAVLFAESAVCNPENKLTSGIAADLLERYKVWWPDLCNKFQTLENELERLAPTRFQKKSDSSEIGRVELPCQNFKEIVATLRRIARAPIKLEHRLARGVTIPPATGSGDATRLICDLFDLRPPVRFGVAANASEHDLLAAATSSLTQLWGLACRGFELVKNDTRQFGRIILAGPRDSLCNDLARSITKTIDGHTQNENAFKKHQLGEGAAVRAEDRAEYRQQEVICIQKVEALAGLLRGAKNIGNLAAMEQQLKRWVAEHKKPC
ncbi:hypothetical protein FACS189481_5730 [Clostridia bacterium]|nr:hypothetical protein FACS189481_5730 [Clostridia bacterium]